LELKNRIWMNGNLEWFAYLGDETIFLGRREVPYPLREGDRWSNGYGDEFRIIAGEIVSNRKGSAEAGLEFPEGNEITYSCED